METIIYGLALYGVIFLIAAAVQAAVCVKLPKLRLLPPIAAGCGLAFCALLFLPRGLMHDPLAEDRYFSLVLMTIFLTAAVGCLAGWLAAGYVTKKKHADG